MRGLAILSSFSSKRNVLGIADLADQLGMHRSTIHRYVTTLLALGYLEQDQTRKYRLGLRVTDLGVSALNATGLREHARPYLEELRQRTSCPASLGVLDGTDVVYLDHVRSHHCTHDIDLDLPAGSRAPAHCTSIGKLLLAHLPAPEQHALITQMRLTKHGPNTVTSKKALRAELAVIVLAGFAVEDQELAAKRYSIAVPIRNADREVVAGVSLAIASSLITLRELVDALSPHLTTTADQISARGHFRRDDQQST